MSYKDKLITCNDVANFIRIVVKRFRENPLVNLQELSHLGMVLSSIGFIKDNNALKLLGDLVSDIPDKLRNLITLKYTLVGTVGEVQTTISQLTLDAINSIVEALNDLANCFEECNLSSEALLEIIGRIYELIVIRLPEIVVTSEQG